MADRVDVNHEAIRDLLCSQDVLRELTQRGERIQSAAGPGHGIHAEIGRNRARVSVFTESPEAMRGEAIDHRLLRSLDAGR